MSSTWNNKITFSIFGESHGQAIGVCMDNIPAGESLDIDEIYKFMARRAPKKDGLTTPRSEKDIPRIVSGFYNGKTTGTPICAMIANTDQHSQDYSRLSKLARPGHADYTGALRYRGFNDFRGGGHFSGRLTAPLCFAGAVAQQILRRRGIYIGAHIAQIHGIQDKSFDVINTSKDDIRELWDKDFPVIIDVQGNEMKKEIKKAREAGDSVGGVIEAIAINVPAGIGSPMFDGLENSIAQLIFGIPAVKGLEFGAGFASADLTGSENNDEFYVNDNGHVVTKTNNHGGILGGISSGMPITLRVAVKPTPSISKPQETVDYSAMKNETLEIKGRHDPCIVPRAVPAVEAALNIAILNHMLDYPNF